MSHSTHKYIVSNISLPVDASVKEAFSVVKRKFKKLGIDISDNKIGVYRRSIDARKKNDIKFVYSIYVDEVSVAIKDEYLKRESITEDKTTPLDFKCGDVKIYDPVIVVGSGPCGLFCSLLLAEAGYPVVLLEKGGDIASRKNAVEKFKRERKLDLSTNIQFGAGGAGTFSDGKLVTRINDPLSSYVISRFVEFGASKDIEYIAKPHIGTDVLSLIVDSMLKRITDLGGKVLYNTEFLNFKDSFGNVKVCSTSVGDMSCSALVLAIGHSARSTYETLIKSNLDIVAKDFSVGMRIEHRADLIDKALYGNMAGNPKLGHAEYNLSYNTKQRGVYTFCMCPGGEVVAATSEENQVVVNGMSYHARDGKNSNSAVLSTVFKEDFGANPLAAIEFQRDIERKAFISAGSNYSAPITSVGAFLKGDVFKITDVIPTYMDGVGVSHAAPEKYLPKFVIDNIKSGITAFDSKISGFAASSAILTGPETRTSAPLRINRDNQTHLAFGYTNLYPAGEGAGYAGGITSAAIDGVKIALSIISKYKP